MQVDRGVPRLLHVVIRVTFSRLRVGSTSLQFIETSYTINGVTHPESSAALAGAFDATGWDPSGYLNLFPAMDTSRARSAVPGNIYYFAIHNTVRESLHFIHILTVRTLHSSTIQYMLSLTDCDSQAGSTAVPGAPPQLSARPREPHCTPLLLYTATLNPLSHVLCCTALYCTVADYLYIYGVVHNPGER